MGGRKTKLARSDRYGLLKATELAAEMIAEYERGRDGARELRVESLEETIWDDIIATFTGHTDKWQVKRLLEPFDRDDAAAIVAAASGAHSSSTRLHFGVASLVEVKKARKGTKGEEFGLSELAQLCQEARKPGVEPDDFEKQEKGRACYKFIKTSLGDGASAALIVGVLQRLWVHELGLEDNLQAKAIAHLKDVFQNHEEVVKQLHNWFVQNPDGKILVDVGLLYTHVVDVYGDRDPSRPRWVHFARDPAKPRWEVRGPLRLDNVVSCAWGSGASVRVQLGSSPFKRDAASAALARLVLHQSSRTTAEAADPGEWQRHGMNLCGGTLGRLGENPDITFNSLTMTPTGAPLAHVAENDLADKLATFMNDAVWTAYAPIVAKHLHEDDLADDVRAAMKAAWADWHTMLNPFPNKRSNFLRSMLATAEEWTRTGFDRALRTGRLRVEDLARTTIIALAVAAALNEGSTKVTVRAAEGVDNLMLGTVPAHAIALAAASHPSEGSPCGLCDAPRAMLDGENGIAILGMVGEASNELFIVASSECLPFHVSDDSSQKYLYPGDPFPILTAGPLLRAAMRKGLTETRAHLAHALGQMNDERVSRLQQVVQGTHSDG